MSILPRRAVPQQGGDSLETHASVEAFGRQCVRPGAAELLRCRLVWRRLHVAADGGRAEGWPLLALGQEPVS